MPGIMLVCPLHFWPGLQFIKFFIIAATIAGFINPWLQLLASRGYAPTTFYNVIKVAHRYAVEVSDTTMLPNASLPG